MGIVHPDALLVPKGTIRILQAKQALGLSEHSVEYSYFDITEMEHLHKQSLGKGFLVRWIISDRDRVATISWRRLTEAGLNKVKFNEVMSRIETLENKN